MDWLAELEAREPDIYAKCLAFVLLLRDSGFHLRRPIADILRDGIYELRVKNGRPNYRILYFFCGQNEACISHGITKESEVPDQEIDLAIERKKLVQSDKNKYSLQWKL
jgi:phage-related protein